LKRKGKFESAAQGSVFLDEISTIDKKVQVGLLRLIEQHKLTRLGGRRAKSIDVRIIAASNQDLWQAVQRGIFREDLYYRLNVFHITMPPLAQRQGDIPLLVEYFIRRYNEAFDKRISGVSPDAFCLLENYDWPGNVRELKNIVQRAVLVCDSEVIRPEHFPPRFQPGQLGKQQVTFDVGVTLEEVEREMISRTLAAAGNNRKKTAEMLGISRRALYNKLKRYGIF
jgi:transcriptional regulator with PAS, ATPase and Fis domain